MATVSKGDSVHHIKNWADTLFPADAALLYAYIGHALTIRARIDLNYGYGEEKKKKGKITVLGALKVHTAYNELFHGLTNHLVYRLGGGGLLRPTNSGSLDMLLETAEAYGLKSSMVFAIQVGYARFRRNRPTNDVD